MSKEDIESPTKEAISTNIKELQTSLSWQLEKFHHLQAQARGTITVLLTVVAIVLSVYFSFLRPLPPVSLSDSAVEEALTAFPLEMGALSAILTILVGMLMSLTLFSFSVYLIAFSLYKLLSILLEDQFLAELPIGWQKVDSGGNIELEIETDDRQQPYLSKITNYEIKLSRIHGKYISATVRMVFGFLFLLVSYEYHIYTSNLNLLMIGVLSIGFVVPSSVSVYIFNKTYSIFSNSDRSKIVAQDMRDPEKSVLGYLNGNLVDGMANLLIFVLSLLLVLTWTISILVNYM